MDWAKTTARRDEKHSGRGAHYIKVLPVKISKTYNDKYLNTSFGPSSQNPSQVKREDGSPVIHL